MPSEIGTFRIHVLSEARVGGTRAREAAEVLETVVAADGEASSPRSLVRLERFPAVACNESRCLAAWSTWAGWTSMGSDWASMASRDNGSCPSRRRVRLPDVATDGETFLVSGHARSWRLGTRRSRWSWPSRPGQSGRLAITLARWAAGPSTGNGTSLLGRTALGSARIASWAKSSHRFRHTSGFTVPGDH
jgi:hypothetical protein